MSTANAFDISIISWPMTHEGDIKAMAMAFCEARMKTVGSPFIHYAQVNYELECPAGLEKTVLLKHHASARLYRHGSSAGFAPWPLQTQERHEAICQSLHAEHYAWQGKRVRIAGWFSSAVQSSERTVPLPPPPACGPDELTLILRNVPRKVTQREVLRALCKSGFECQFDFLYMPISLSSGKNMGYVFINFISNVEAGKLWMRWHNQRPFDCCGSQLLSISIAAVQGLKANIENWTQSRSKRVRNPNLCPIIWDPELRRLGSTLQSARLDATLSYPGILPRDGI